MKKFGMVLAIVLVLPLALSSCGLAARNLAKDAAALDKKAAKLEVKTAGIGEKAASLSERNRQIFLEELVRLGVREEEWVFDDAPAIFSGISDIPSTPAPASGGGRTDRALNGTWVDNDDGSTMTFNNGNWELADDESQLVKGTFTTRGNTFALSTIQMHKRTISGEVGSILEPKLYSREEVDAAVFNLVGAHLPAADLDRLFGNAMEGTYSIRGSTLTMTVNGRPATYTKSR